MNPVAAVQPAQVAVICTHVIQHFAPLYRRLAREPGLRLRVFYASESGLRAYRDPGFGREVAWDSDLTSGYDFQFLRGAGAAFRTGFWATKGNGLERSLRAFRPDVIFVFGYAPLVMLRALVYANLRRIPAVMMADSELLRDRPRWKHALKQVLLPPLLRRVSGFLTVGDNNESYWLSYRVPAAKLVRGGFPTDEPRFLEARARRRSLRSEERHRWALQEEDFVALCVGKLIATKRPQDLLEAAARLRGCPGRRVVAVFAGDGALREPLERRASEIPGLEVRFLGFVNQSGLPRVYAAADVLVHASELDAHTLAITEATIMGLPIVVSDRVGAVGPTDTARPGKNAIVYPVGDIDALVRALGVLTDDPEAMARMEAATRQIAAETGMEACVSGFVELVARLTRAHGRRRATSSSCEIARS